MRSPEARVSLTAAGAAAELYDAAIAQSAVLLSSQAEQGYVLGQCCQPIVIVRTREANIPATLIRMTCGSARAKPRANIYVDGFNLYYGALKNTPHKWLDLDALFRTILPAYHIKRIRYFSARISGRAGNPQAPSRQATYLRALRTLPNVTIHLGHFLTSEVFMPLAYPPATGQKTVKVIKTEEKGSDVNLATYLIVDAMRGDCDIAAVVSNDSDLCEPIRIVQQELKLPVGLLNPHPRPSQALLKLKPAFVRPIRSGPLSASQFPALMTDTRGKFSKPTAW